MGDVMSFGLQKQLDDIIQDVGKLANKIARGVALKAQDDMEIAHSMIMVSYYDGYTPVSSYYYKSPKTGATIITNGYRRTGNLGSNSIIPLGVSQVGTHGFKASIQISPTNMSDYVNNMGRTFPASDVFDYVWNYGNRGLPPGNPGHIGSFDVNITVDGISISGRPSNAMDEFMDQWWDVVGNNEADKIAHS